MYKELLEKIAGEPIDFGLEPVNETIEEWVDKLASAYDENEALLAELAREYLPIVEKVAQGEALTPEEAEAAKQIENATAEVATQQAAIEQAAEEAATATLGAIVEETAKRILDVLDPYVSQLGDGVVHAVADVIGEVGDDIIMAAQGGDPESVDALINGIVAALISYTPAAAQAVAEAAGAAPAGATPVATSLAQAAGTPTGTEPSGSAPM